MVSSSADFLLRGFGVGLLEGGKQSLDRVVFFQRAAANRTFEFSSGVLRTGVQGGPHTAHSGLAARLLPALLRT
jgi:hypothetical protein